MSTVECCKFFLFSHSLSPTELSPSLLFILSQCGGGCVSTIRLQWVGIVVAVAVIDWWPLTEYSLISPTLVKIVSGGGSGVAASHRLLALLEWVLSLKLQWLTGLSDNAGLVIGCCLAVPGCVVEWCWVCWWDWVLAPHCVLRDFFSFFFLHILLKFFFYHSKIKFWTLKEA